jgi:hypothetical protein
MDPLQILGLVLLSLFFLSLLSGKQSSLLALGALAAFLAVLAGVAYLFYAGFNIIVLAATAVAGLAGLIIMSAVKEESTEEKETKKPLFDIKLVNEKCVPLEDGVKTLPPNVASAIEKVIGMPSRVYKLCVQTYEGEDVPGGRAEVMALKMLFAPEMIVVRLLSALGELGLHPSAQSRELGWVVYFQKPKPLENSAVGQAGDKHTRKHEETI